MKTKQLIDMAKVAIKSTKITAFKGGFYACEKKSVDLKIFFNNRRGETLFYL